MHTHMHACTLAHLLRALALNHCHSLSSAAVVRGQGVDVAELANSVDGVFAANELHLLPSPRVDEAAMGGWVGGWVGALVAFVCICCVVAGKKNIKL